jgi:hypothetical protein
MLRLRPILLAAMVSASCSTSKPKAAPTPVAEPAMRVRLAPSEPPIAPGDCIEARRRAGERPDLPVDKIPAPLVAKPAALQKVPPSARRKNGSAEIKVDVVIDTMGKADMTTFVVAASSSPWLAANVKSVIGKWTFSPAELAGCKVPRVFHFMASTPARAKARK